MLTSCGDQSAAVETVSLVGLVVICHLPIECFNTESLKVWDHASDGIGRPFVKPGVAGNEPTEGCRPIEQSSDLR